MSHGVPAVNINRRLAGNCSGGPCPHAYELDDGSIAVQGDLVSATLPGKTTLADHERVVRIPRSVALSLARQLIAEV